jgi:hypothetical protein
VYTGYKGNCFSGQALVFFSRQCVLRRSETAVPEICIQGACMKEQIDAPGIQMPGRQY